LARFAAVARLPEGGAFIVMENIIDNARRENTFGLMMSLKMLIEFGDAFDLRSEVILRTGRGHAKPLATLFAHCCAVRGNLTLR